MPFLTRLQAELPARAPTAEILTVEHSTRFQDYAKRWSDIDRKTPAAIVLPTTEGDIQHTVQWCLEAAVPFVTSSGGHSEWSTIDQRGIIIDLSHYQSLEIHAAKQEAVIRGSVLVKPLAVALAAEGLFTALGNGNTVGVIPYMLNGGVSVTNQVTGYGSDQILAARMIDARGQLVVVNDSSHPDLLWALRGAGQFFGLVTELTIRVHPFSALGNTEGMIWLQTFVFPIDRATDVADAMTKLMNNSKYATAGLMMVASPPPKQQPTLVIAARYTGPLGNAQEAYQPLHDLQPLVTNGGLLPIQNASDGRAEIGAKGGFKRFTIAGLPSFNPAGFLTTIDIYREMTEKCPGTSNSAFMAQWDANLPRKPSFESSTSLHETRFWQNNLIWYTDASHRSQVEAYDAQCVAVMRGADPSQWQDYQNATRDGPIERRFRPTAKLQRLRAVKQAWDPQGIFSHQLLDD